MCTYVYTDDVLLEECTHSKHICAQLTHIFLSSLKDVNQHRVICAFQLIPKKGDIIMYHCVCGVRIPLLYSECDTKTLAHVHGLE